MQLRIAYRALHVLVVSTLMALGLAVMSVAPARADTTDHFSVCVPDWCSLSYADGTITWFNRTAKIQGKVVDIDAGSTVVIFKAYAGTNQIGPTQTRTADDENPNLGQTRPYNFVIGDTNLVGGINRITVQVCSNGICSSVHTYTK
jgi:hypothetical protein